MFTVCLTAVFMLSFMTEASPIKVDKKINLTDLIKYDRMFQETDEYIIKEHGPLSRLLVKEILNPLAEKLKIEAKGKYSAIGDLVSEYKLPVPLELENHSLTKYSLSILP